jgi:hypothetical protein
MIDGPGAYGRLDPNVLSLLEELQRLRAAIEGMSHRLAALERGNRELRDAVRAGRSLEATESPDSTEPDTPTEPPERPREQSSARRQYVLGTLLIALVVLAVEGMKWLHFLFGFEGVVGTLVSFNLLLFVSVIGPFALAFYVGFRRDHPVSWRFLGTFGVVVAVVLSIVSYFAWNVSEALTRLIYLISGSAKLGEGLRTWERLERAMVFDPTGLLIGYGIISAGAYVTFLSGGALSNALRRRRLPAPQLRPRENRAASTEWSPKKQAFLGFAGTVLGSVIGLIGTIITVIAGR